MSGFLRFLLSQLTLTRLPLTPSSASKGCVTKKQLTIARKKPKPKALECENDFAIAFPNSTVLARIFHSPLLQTPQQRPHLSMVRNAGTVPLILFYEKAFTEVSFASHLLPFGRRRSVRPERLIHVHSRCAQGRQHGRDDCRSQQHERSSGHWKRAGHLHV